MLNAQTFSVKINNQEKNFMFETSQVIAHMGAYTTFCMPALYVSFVEDILQLTPLNSAFPVQLIVVKPADGTHT